jgi:hypothetical protein
VVLWDGWIKMVEETPEQTLIELNKIKVLLLALWDDQPHPEAQKIVQEFRQEIKG